MQLLISNEQNQVPIDKKVYDLIQKALDEVLKEEEFFTETEVSLVLVDDVQMAELNKKYRGVEGTTDVLAFPMLKHEFGEPEILDLEEEILLGDVVISVPRALEQAAFYGTSFPQEMVFLAVHGMLHLLGYEHETPEEVVRMRERENMVLIRCGFKTKEYV